MYIGNRLTGAYGIGVFKLRHTFSNYIIRILECQLFFTHILHFFVNCESVFREIQTTYVFTRNPIRDTGSAPGSDPPAWPLLPPFFDPSPQGFLLLSPADNHPFQPQAVFR